MKHPRRLTRSMKILLSEKGYRPEEWIYIRKYDGSIIITHRWTGIRKLVFEERRFARK